MLYNSRMKILIAPMIQTPRLDSTYFLCNNLIPLLQQNGHRVALSAMPENNFHQVSLYEGPRPRHHVFTSTARTYEEWLYNTGAADYKYLQNDYATLLSAIDNFKPDRIISMDRIAACAAARNSQIPCIEIVNSAMYRYTDIAPNIMKGINAFLSSIHLEQVFDMKDFYRQNSLCIGFGPIEPCPFPLKENVQRIGIPSVYPLHKKLSNRVCVYLSHVKMKPRNIRKLLIEAFQGAPYVVSAWYKGSHTEKVGNVHFTNYPDSELLCGSMACIHDGDPYIYHECMAIGLPQLMIYDKDWNRMSIAQAIRRCGFGIAMPEEDFNIRLLYEQYRNLVIDDDYYDNTQKIKDQILSEGDLTQIFQYLSF